MPSELQQNRYDQLIRRVGGVVGPGSKVSEVLTELFPVLEVENTPNELKLLAGTAIAFGGTGVNASVANTPKAQLFNPANSGKLITCTRVDITSTDAGVVRYGIEGSRGLPVGSEQFADSRLGAGVNPTGRVQFSEDLGLSIHSGRVDLLAATPFSLIDDKGLFVLAPNTGVTFNCEVIDSQMDVSFFWRERIAEQSELNF